jgi:hypothetical protein
MFGEQLLMPHFEERAAVQQSTGAARPIHAWPAEGAAEIAKGFDWLLAGALSDLERDETKRERLGTVGRATRGMASPLAGLTERSVDDTPKSRKAAKKKGWFRR